MKKKFRKGLLKETVMEISASPKEQQEITQGVRDLPVEFEFDEKAGVVKILNRKRPAFAPTPPCE